jgi:hypothetical protein
VQVGPCRQPGILYGWVDVAWLLLQTAQVDCTLVQSLEGWPYSWQLVHRIAAEYS